MDNQSYLKPFPTLKAETLSKEEVVFPEITKGKFAFILIAFRRQTQGEVDSWLDPFIEEFGGKERITFYEIPMISGNWKWMSSWIDSGMRMGVPEYKHDHVATYYGPLDEYLKYFQIEDTSKVYVFLLDKEENIIWREEGTATDEKFESLREKLKNQA